MTVEWACCGSGRGWWCPYTGGRLLLAEWTCCSCLDKAFRSIVIGAFDKSMHISGNYVMEVLLSLLLFRLTVQAMAGGSPGQEVDISQLTVQKKNTSRQ